MLPKTPFFKVKVKVKVKVKKVSYNQQVDLHTVGPPIFVKPARLDEVGRAHVPIPHQDPGVLERSDHGGHRGEGVVVPGARCVPWCQVRCRYHSVA